MRRPGATIDPRPDSPASPSARPLPSIAPLLALAAIASGAAPTDDPPAPEGGRNRLGAETSPYLLQHAGNPVHWFPWGPEAFEEAKARDKPVFLSIGYRSCYWCHVMERECFEDEAIAAQLNEHFVCIKVDREERPDVDQIYMTALQGISGGAGGWPMSMFLAPDGRPFYGGTYFPPEPRDGMPSFPQLLDAIQAAWLDRRDEVLNDATQLTAYVRRVSDVGLALEAVPIDRRLPMAGLEALASQFDPEFGGFGFDPDQPKRPKFPEPVNLAFLLDQHRRGRSPVGAVPGPREMTLETLDHLSRGGIRDHLAGGYHRYSTDRAWAVPHFEKMLYDNAQLVPVFLRAHELTDDPRWAAEARATLDFVSSAMRGPDGGFASSLDAESDGEEGMPYVWTREEVKALLGDEASYALFATAYGLDREPNFEGGRYVLLRPEPPGPEAVALGLAPEQVEDRLAPLRTTLLDAREARAQPFLDDTVLTSWNGLMLGAFADASRALDAPQYLEIAEQTADFLLGRLRDADGRLLRSYRSGVARLPGYLEDYAFFIDGLLRIHEATGDPIRLDEARSLADRMIADFADDDRGGFFFTAADHESLVARVKEPYDDALPGPNAVAIRDLIALHRLTGEASYLDVAGDALEAFAPAIGRSPGSAPMMLLAVDEYLDARSEPGAAQADAEPAPAFSPGRLATPAGPGQGGQPAAGRPIVSAEAGGPDRPVRPGSPFEVRVALTIADPYHLNANPAGAANLIPTTLALPDDSPAELVEVSYPDPVRKALAGQEAPIPLFEGTATLTARLLLADDAPAGPLTLTLRLRYQACDDRSCLAPANLEVPVRLDVAPADPGT
ncbi:thioredoxin domain-containing protein [Tautonia plasticadhaerens]|uniref:N-acylglucosamine 2-epimerase (GlcNAc 2-epimerase) n=1 Tax=Tautonia plasticadhaerens TaxID=2527974 RepID=A0A518HAA6_9BACT|nr:thioredoxin domain-containing protein [Tautonia plasticadhaerens]QDV37737.1 N-acylglucosamine 2-epimerase (GlcNAc 2-epimerase) [Tautonia plasticadhaerens]